MTRETTNVSYILFNMDRSKFWCMSIFRIVLRRTETTDSSFQPEQSIWLLLARPIQGKERYFSIDVYWLGRHKESSGRTVIKYVYNSSNINSATDKRVGEWKFWRRTEIGVWSLLLSVSAWESFNWGLFTSEIRWRRLIMHKGHAMRRGKEIKEIKFASWISAQRRWVITWTLKPQTIAQSSLSYMNSMLHFLEHDFFGSCFNGDQVCHNEIVQSWNDGHISLFSTFEIVLPWLWLGTPSVISLNFLFRGSRSHVRT